MLFLYSYYLLQPHVLSSWTLPCRMLTSWLALKPCCRPLNRITL